MLVALTAVLVTGFYAANVPVKLAFCARAGERMGVALSARPFEGRFALRSAQKRLDDGKKPPKPDRRKLPVNAVLQTARRLMKHVRLDRLEISLEMGLADAAATAMAVGLARALLAAVGAATGASVRARLRPDFQNARFRGEISGIISLSVGHIIYAALRSILENGGRNQHGQASD